jgi:ferritin-like metal-binding protein YciE
MADLSAGDGKLVQYLNEAYGKEKELETALEAHIGMTTRAPYKKRLREHLTETKRHAREVERRIKQLGGTAQTGPIEGSDPLAKGAGAAVEIAGRAAALAKGPLHALRGTGEQEKMLKNAKTEYAEEHEEIATYTAIEALAETLGDRDTVALARAIRREEERMAKFLERQIPMLTKAVAQAEVPASERSHGSKRRKPARSAGAGGAAKASARTRGKAAAGRKAAGARGKASGARSKGTGPRATGGGARPKRAGTRGATARPRARAVAAAAASQTRTSGKR